MEFFDEGYSIQEEQKEEKVQQITDEKPLIKEHWLRADSDDDDEYAGGAMTKEEESMSKIDTLIFDFTCKIQAANWKGARKVFADLSRAVALHKQRYKMVPESFLDCLEESLDTAKLIQEDGEIEVFGGNNESTKTVSVDTKGAKFIITQLAEALEQYSDDIAKMGMVDEEDEEDENAIASDEESDAAAHDESSTEKSFDDYAALAVRTASEKDSKLKIWRNIIAGSKKNNYTAITIYALCRAAEAVIQESRQFIISMSEWRAAFAYIRSCFVLLCANPSIRLVETGDEIAPRRVPMHGGLCRHIQNLHTHLGYMTMLNEAGYQLEQLEIPVCEHMIVDLSSALLMYYQTISYIPGTVSSCRILINLLSPRPQIAHTILYPMMSLQQKQAQTSKTELTVTESVLDSVTTLYRVLFRLGGREDKMRAVCCLSYQLALSGKYREGLDTIRRSGVWSYIYPEDGNVNRALSILYNRAVVQLGLVAFYAGDVQTSYELLGPFWSMSEPELLIGQAMPRRFYMLAPEIQLDYRDSLIPMHWRISKQNIELAAMLVALIVDSKREAETPYARSRHQQYFYQVIKRKYQSFGESAQLHDQVATAYNALKTGNFVEVKEVVESMTAWDSVPNKDEVLARYIRHLKEASLTIFCYANRCTFSTFSVEQLSIKYDMDAQDVRNVINQIIADHKTVIAYWDQNDSYLYVDRNNLTELQHIIKATAESAYSLAPFTERREAVPRRN